MTFERCLFPFLLTAAVAAAASCDSLANLKIPSTTITLAATVEAGAFTPSSGRGGALYKSLPAFCRVQGVIAPSADSQIEFEVWLPASNWNGKYEGVGNGGFAGSIGYTQLAAGVAAGYVVSSTDTGHKAGATDAQWALGHFEKIVDFGHRAIHDTAEDSKAIAKAFYGDAPKRSYFNGCSDGGREALMEAERYPADYDGIVAGSPANYWTHLLAEGVWNMQALLDDPASFIPVKKLAAIDAAAVAACDALDGVKDGVIDDPTRCHFDPSVIECKGADADTCLTAPQVVALKKIYAGAKNSKGEQVFPGYEPGGELGTGGWGAWITGFSPGKSLGASFAGGFFADMVFQDPKWDFKTFNYDRDLKLTDDKMGPVLNAVNPDLKAFKGRGGKLIMYHGWSDAAISPTNTIHYYNSVTSKMGQKNTAEFVRLYMVPGMQHCGGGPGVTDFGAQAFGGEADHSVNVSLEHWVENGAAPSKIIATKYKTDGNPSSGTLRTRPLCPYPQVERYKGSGSTDDAANFTCAAPMK